MAPLELIAAGVAQTLAAACRSQSDAAAVLEAVQGALLLMDNLLRRFEMASPLPRAIACRPGCGFCCYNQVELTPPEIMVIGHFIGTRFSHPQRQWLAANVKFRWSRQAGLSKVQLAARRREHPCPLLVEDRCMVYPVRPLTCRAMHAVDEQTCRTSLETGELIPDQYYQEPHNLALAISRGLRTGAAQAGLQADTLGLVASLGEFFLREDTLARWLAGEVVFAGKGP